MTVSIMLVEALLAVTGALTSIVLARRINSAASAINSPSLRLLAVAFTVFSLALLMDALALLLYQHTPNYASHGISIVAGKRPREVTFLIINRAAILAQPLYMIAYTLYAVSIYYSHLPIEEKRLYALPLIAAVYVDYNIVALVLLALTGYMVYERGSMHTRWLVFYFLLAASHALAILALHLTNTTLLSLSMSLRAVAPLLLATYSIK